MFFLIHFSFLESNYDIEWSILWNHKGQHEEIEGFLRSLKFQNVEVNDFSPFSPPGAYL